MLDETTDATSGESSTPTNDVGTAGAGGDDATFDAGSTGQPGAESAQSEQEEFSPGWSLEDEAAEVETEDLTDEQLQQYLSDPRLNQEKAPELLADLRESRAQRNALRTEVRQLREQLAGTQGINGPVAGLASKMIANPAEGVIPFLSELVDKAAPAYKQIADAYIENEADYLIGQLQARGLLPEASQNVTRASSINQEVLATIPENRRQLYKDLYSNAPAEVQEDYDAMSEAARNHMLEREAKLQSLDAYQQNQARQAWAGQVKQAEADGAKLVQDLSDQFEKAHFAQLNKWQPFGPEGGTHNQLLYKVVLEGAFAQLMEDQNPTKDGLTYQQMFNDCLGLLKNSPMRRLNKEDLAADDDARKGRELAARFNTALGNKMRDLIKHPQYGLDGVFRDARAWRESQRQAAPDRKEIPGVGLTATNNGGQRKSNLNPDGSLSDNLMGRIMDTIGVKRGS